MEFLNPDQRVEVLFYIEGSKDEVEVAFPMKNIEVINEDILEIVKRKYKPNFRLIVLITVVGYFLVNLMIYIMQK